MTDIEYKKLIKAYPNKSTASSNKEAASSSSEAPTAIYFLSSSDYNIFKYIILDLRQEIRKGKKNYPRTVTRAYDMITRFDLESPRRNHTERMGDKGNREHCGGRGGMDCTFVQHTASSGTVFIPGLDRHTSYQIKCFNSEKWRHYESQCP